MAMFLDGKPSRFPPGKGWSKRSDLVNVHFQYVATDPSRKNPSLYEMIPSETPNEAVEEWKKLLGWYESEHNGPYFSKSESERAFRDALDRGLCSLTAHISATKTGLPRPKLHPPIIEHFAVVTELEIRAPNYLSRQFRVVSDGESSSDEGEDTPAFACNFPSCTMIDEVDNLRNCVICGANGKHHHLCAINVGQEEQSTLCFYCMDGGVLSQHVDDHSNAELQNAALQNAELQRELSEYPVLQSPKESLKGSLNSSRSSSPPCGQPENFTSLDSMSSWADAAKIISSPASIRSYGVASTAASRLLFGYCSGVQIDIPGDGKCFFKTSTVSATYVNLSENALAFLTKSVDGLKRNIAIVLSNDDPCLDLRFDFRVGCPPEPDENASSLTASIRDLCAQDFNCTPSEYIPMMMRPSHYGGVLEAMVIASQTCAVLQMGQITRIPLDDEKSIFQPMIQIVRPDVALALYDSRDIVRYCIQGFHHFNAFRPDDKMPAAPNMTILHPGMSVTKVRRSIIGAVEKATDEMADEMAVDGREVGGAAPVAAPPAAPDAAPAGPRAAKVSANERLDARSDSEDLDEVVEGLDEDYSALTDIESLDEASDSEQPTAPSVKPTAPSVPLPARRNPPAPALKPAAPPSVKPLARKSTPLMPQLVNLRASEVATDASYLADMMAERARGAANTELMRERVAAEMEAAMATGIRLNPMVARAFDVELPPLELPPHRRQISFRDRGRAPLLPDLQLCRLRQGCPRSRQ